MKGEKNVKKLMITVVAVFTLLSVITQIVSLNNKPKIDSNGRSYIERNNYGNGRKSVELEANLKEHKDTININLEERQYTLEELEKVFDDGAKKLETLVLGENESIDKVQKDLNFITYIPDTSIKVMWFVEESDIVDYNGHVDLSKADEGRNLVMLKAVLSYGSNEAEHIFYVNVVKDKLSPGEKKIENIRKELIKREEDTRSRRKIILPKSESGEEIKWKYKKDSDALAIFLLGIVAAFAIYVEDKQKESKKEKVRKEMLMTDYPNIVSQLTLFISAGMAISNAWRKMTYIYVDKRDTIGVRPAYEEMIYTVHQLDKGMSEEECYLEFGTRLDLSPYRKLGTMLASNLRKGNKNLSKMLKKEAFDALELRKNEAKKKGEEASTKLLGPMFVMLAVLLAIIVIPAFLSIQI